MVVFFTDDAVCCAGCGTDHRRGFFVMVRLHFVGVIDGAECNPVGRWSGKTVCLGKERKGIGASGGQGDALLDGARGIPNKSEFDGFAGFGSGGENGGWTRCGTDVEAVVAVVIALVGCLAYEDAIIAIFRCDDGGKTIGAQQRRIIARAHLESLGIEDRNICVEHFLAEADGLDFDGEALAFFEMTEVKIFVF